MMIHEITARQRQLRRGVDRPLRRSECCTKCDVLHVALLQIVASLPGAAHQPTGADHQNLLPDAENKLVSAVKYSKLDVCECNSKRKDALGQERTNIPTIRLHHSAYQHICD
jgi:hypothetical protein